MKNFVLASVLTAAASLAAASHGTLCLTFDDRYFNSWLDSDRIFKTYDARVTFFVCGKIDEQAIPALKKLQQAGHSIGLHALDHAKVTSYAGKQGEETYTQKQIMPQLSVCLQNNIRIRAFAYPYSRRTEESDSELFKTFDFLRANCAGVKSSTEPLEKADGCFVKNLRQKQLFHGFPASGDFNMQEVKDAMKRAAEDNAVLVFYAHDITVDERKTHHISHARLIQILEYAKTLGMAVRGMNEL